MSFPCEIFWIALSVHSGFTTGFLCVFSGGQSPLAVDEDQFKHWFTNTCILVCSVEFSWAPEALYVFVQTLLLQGLRMCKIFYVLIDIRMAKKFQHHYIGLYKS